MEVNFLGILGSDATIVNSARVSYGRRIDVNNPLSGRDKRLIRYLAKHQHWSPFRHVVLQFHVKCPEFVARQMYKHVVGIETTSAHPTKDHAWNEISGRYVELRELYTPKLWRKQSESNKQASAGPLPLSEQAQATSIYAHYTKTVMQCYEGLLELGVAREQARMVLPLSFMTEFYWTASLQAVMNFIILRDSPEAQKEIRDLAIAMRNIVKKEVPVAYAELEEVYKVQSDNVSS